MQAVKVGLGVLGYGVTVVVGLVEVGAAVVGIDVYVGRNVTDGSIEAVTLIT
jgi:hypothetical protein